MKFILKGNPLSTGSIYKSHCKFGFPTCYMSAEGKLKKETYKWELIAQKAKLFKGELAIKIKLYFNTHGKHDVDNFNKLILDAGSGILYDDDSQIKRLVIEKSYDKLNPRVELEIYNFYD